MAALGPLPRVVLWMIGTLLSFSVMAISIRALSDTLSILEILTVRAALGLAILALAAALRPDLRHTVVRRKLGLHVLRNSIHFGSQYLWASRACAQLSRIIAEASWTPARKFLASLS
jgi:hypothetical protein